MTVPDFSKLTNKELADMGRKHICMEMKALLGEDELIYEMMNRLESYDDEQKPVIDLHLIERMIINASVILQDLQAIYRKETGQNYKPFW